MNFETETQIRLRRAKHDLANAREVADSARRALAEADKAVRQAKERYEALFLAEEAEKVKRRKKTVLLQYPGDPDITLSED